ncbi:MAG: SDR family oxidoreductase [Acidobacteria bacterium]|nr:SDR family oxidoreductase [Acidobacteriota bacterium]MCA1611834.1 SDR family oxidoreductase [Acidobacteriota bacterium]
MTRTEAGSRTAPLSRGAAVVTGASSGIGLEIARLLAADGYDLLLVASGERKLLEVAARFSDEYGRVANAFAVDLARSDGAGSLLREIERRGLVVDVLVNNAGFGVYGLFAAADPARTLEMIQVNVTSLTELTRGVLPRMTARRSGRILNVASTAAFQPGPLMAVYYATKAYVLSFSEALANELAGSGVTVTALCPGSTRTAFQERAGLKRTPLAAGPLVGDARRVAQAGHRGMLRGRRVVVPGLANRVMMHAVRITPRRLVTAIARRIQESKI